MDSLVDYQFLDNELQYFSSKNNVIPFASENLYSLCYGIDKKDNRTKIFIGETDDFDELMNSNNSLLKIYNFMKQDSLTIEY